MRRIVLLSFTLLATRLLFVGCADDGATPSPDSASSSSGSTSSSSGVASSTGGPAADMDSGMDSGTSSSSSSSSSTSSSGALPPTCNELVQQDAIDDLIATQSPAPVAQGGVIADGTWVQSSSKLWGATAAQDGQKVGVASANTWKITGTNLEIVATSQTGKVSHRNFTLTTTGITYAVASTCENPADGGVSNPTGEYTATLTTLSLYVHGPGTEVVEFAFTKP